MLDVFEDVTIEQMKADGDWPNEWNPAKNIRPYVKRLGENIRCLMIGIDRGEVAYYLLENCPNIKYMCGIDSYKEYITWNNVLITQEKQNKTKELADKNLKDFKGSKYFDASNFDKDFRIDPNSFDFVYIDGRTYEQAKSVYTQYYNTLKTGGLFVGSNHNIIGIQIALKEFREENKIRIPIQLADTNTFFWSKV